MSDKMQNIIIVTENIITGVELKNALYTILDVNAQGYLCFDNVLIYSGCAMYANDVNSLKDTVADVIITDLSGNLEETFKDIPNTDRSGGPVIISLYEAIRVVYGVLPLVSSGESTVHALTLTGQSWECRRKLFNSLPLTYTDMCWLFTAWLERPFNKFCPSDELRDCLLHFVIMKSGEELFNKSLKKVEDMEDMEE